MSAIKLIACTLLLTLACSLHAADLDAAYAPTRAEWLKQSISTSISEQSNAWSKRFATIVVVLASDNRVIISVTLANGEPEPTQEVKARYIQRVQSIARGVIDRYTWAKDTKLEVTFA